MFGHRNFRFTVFLSILLVIALLVVPALDTGGQFLPFVLTPCPASDVSTTLVATGYAPSEQWSTWLKPQAANLASRAPPNPSIS